MLKEKMAELHQILIRQANCVEKMIEKSTKGLLQNNKELLNEVISNDEPQVNQLEIKIDEFCMTILALYHPEAKDLRSTMMIAKMTSDLERMADCAVNICESALFLVDKPVLATQKELPIISEETIRMVRSSIDAFINEKTDVAMQVCQCDEKVDALHDKILKELVEDIAADTAIVERGMHLFRIAKNFEKIADLATNIAEETVYIVKGIVIKHHKNENTDQNPII